jgi:hypothetical protein
LLRVVAEASVAALVELVLEAGKARDDVELSVVESFKIEVAAPEVNGEAVVVRLTVDDTMLRWVDTKDSCVLGVAARELKAGLLLEPGNTVLGVACAVV